LTPDDRDPDSPFAKPSSTLIDDAILNRSPRFDVKCDFTLPSEPPRERFAFRWTKKTRVSASEVDNPFAWTDAEPIAGDIARRGDNWTFVSPKNCKSPHHRPGTTYFN
jgi:hypothetical protein